LGLAIVRHLVELHGGKVSVESEGIGMGATFSVDLPLAIEQNDYPDTNDNLYAAQSRDEFREAPCLDGVRVLAVDDDPDSLSLIKAVFEPIEVEIKTASGMSEALEILSGWWPDVLVSDIGMPNGDGYELIRRIRTHVEGPSQKLSAVALTAYGSNQDRMLALSSGFQMHLVKPIDPSELITVIASLTGRLGAGQSVGT
ncbi:MAG TPA: response regulator, partial [Blastocatellia bacterium]|nr:response regulator [Blastocatellia bacterium]